MTSKSYAGARVMRALVPIATIALSLTTGGCGEDYESVNVFEAPAGPAFTYECQDDDDAQCDEATPKPAVSDGKGFGKQPRIAKGSVFDLYGGTGSPDLKFPLTRVLPNGGKGFIAKEAGVAYAVFGKQADHIEIVEPVAIIIRHESVEKSGNFDQILGKDSFAFRLPQDRFRATLVDEDGNPLAGSGGMKWRTSDETNVSIPKGRNSTIATFAVATSGHTELTVSALGLEASFSFDLEFN